MDFFTQIIRDLFFIIICVAIMTILIAVICSPIIIICLIIYRISKKHNKQKETWHNTNKAYTNNQYQYTEPGTNTINLNKYPYKKKRLLTQTEYHFYQILKEECDERNLLICPKVRMEDFIDTTTKAEKQKYRGYIRHIDFIICDKELNIITGLELDDESHNNPNTQKTDRLKNNIFEYIGIPLMRINVKSGKYREQIINILDYLINYT